MNREMKDSSTKKLIDKEEPMEAAKNDAEVVKSKVKFEIFGEEMIEKKVKLSGNSGRVYLPPTWVGHSVKIIRID
jgi:putative transposon-encoded protein